MVHTTKEIGNAINKKKQKSGKGVLIHQNVWKCFSDEFHKGKE